MRILLFVGLVLIGLGSFAQDKIENPYVVINGKHGNVIHMSKSELKYWQSITTNNTDLFQISNFDLVLVVNQVEIRLHSKSYKLTPEMKKYIQSSNQIKELVVDKVNIRVSDGTTRIISGSTIDIK